MHGDRLSVNKQALQDQILHVLRAELDVCLAAAKAATAAATDPDSKAENKYDTRTLEASYLARGQAFRVAELQEAVAAYEAMGAREFTPGQGIALGALVCLQGEEGELLYFLGPAAGGTEAEVEGGSVLAITPSSPLGQCLMGRREGEQVKLPGGPARVLRVS